jgi:hypothetical protein
MALVIELMIETKMYNVLSPGKKESENVSGSLRIENQSRQ